MHNFTPVPSLEGGILIGLSASLLLLANGRVAGISGIFGGLLVPRSGDSAWRAWFVAGLLLGGFAFFALRPASFRPPGASLALVGAAGVLVGFGTRLGGGCTSGHGVCGLSRLSPRSLAATIVFMGAGFATVFVTRHLLA